MKKKQLLVRGGAAPEGSKWLAGKYGLTLSEAATLATHPRRDQIVDEHDEWCLSVGAAPSSALSRGRLLDGLRDGTLDNPLLGVSGWWWVAGAAAAAVVGYFVLRKSEPTSKLAAKPAQWIPLASFASPADYITKTSSAVGGYGSAYAKKWKGGQRTSDVPFAVRNVWFRQEIVFKRRAFERNFWANGQVPPAMPDSYFASKFVVRNFYPPLEGVSTQKFLLFRPQNNVAAKPNGTACPGTDMSADCEAVWGWNPTDEWGNAYEGWGKGSDPFATVLLIVQTALPYIPGVGTGAAAALAGVIALGQGKSLDEAALAGARAALPAGAQLAFDLGVGVAQGKPVDQALTDAALGELEKKYPGSKAAYAQGQKMAKQSGLGRVLWSCRSIGSPARL